MGAIAADDVFGVNGALLTLVVTSGVAQAVLSRLRPASVVNREVDVLDAVIRGDPAGPEVGGLGEVIEHSGLVDDEVGEFAHVIGVIDGALGTDNVLGLIGIRIPEVHVPDVVRLGSDVLGEPEGLEGLHASRLDPIGLTELEAPGAALDDPSGEGGVVGHLRREQHPGGPRTNDEHIDLARKITRAVDAGSCGGLFPRLLRYVPVMVKLHCSIPFPRTAASRSHVECSIYEHATLLSNRSYMMAGTGATRRSCQGGACGRHTAVASRVANPEPGHQSSRNPFGRRRSAEH